MNTNGGNQGLQGVPTTPARGPAAGHLLEEGAAFEALGPGAGARYDVIVIGAGQAGLAVGQQLQRRGLRFLIVDGGARVGDVWRGRWDSLRLFTPARFDSLPGLPFPGDPDAFPTKDEMADYLEGYVRHFALPVRTGFRVQRLSKRGTGESARFVVQSGAEELEAAQVIVAMGSYQKGRAPAFARELDPGIVQLHASAYRNVGQLRPGAVLLVGGGNSGAEIGIELARAGHRTFMAGRDNGEVPFRMSSFWGRWLLCRLVLRFVFHRLLTLKTPMGRKVRPVMITKGGPLIRTKGRDLAAAGVERTVRVAGVRDGKPVLDDGRVLDVANVVWCTGFDGAFSWIDLPVIAPDGEPIHEAGVVTQEPGLYFVGLHFLYSFSSGMIHGVGRDAARIAGAAAAHARSTGAAAARVHA